MTLTLKLTDLPEVSFAEVDAEQILADIVAEYENAYFEQTGKRKRLYPGDPIRIFLYTRALREIQLRTVIDDTGKQNLLKYARGENLVNLGAFTKTEPAEPTAASTVMYLVLSEAQPFDIVIPAGTRVSPGEDLQFSNRENLSVPAGQTSLTYLVYCEELGEVGNGFLAGQINQLSDPLPYVATVENIDESKGGFIESEESYRERIHEAPEGFSVAGPSGAYEHLAKKFMPSILHVKAVSPSPGIVDMRFILQSGEIPTESIINELSNHLNERDRRPLTDQFSAGAPELIEYDVDVTYYLRSTDIESLVKTRENVDNSVDEFITWQRSRIGRDVNPSELIAKMVRAGAKRVEVRLPEHIEIDNLSLAVVNVKTVEYGGIEDD